MLKCDECKEYKSSVRRIADLRRDLCDRCCLKIMRRISPTGLHKKLKIRNGDPAIPQREGRPDYKRYHPSRKARLRAGRQVGRKGRK